MDKYITFVLDSFELEEYKVSQFEDTLFCYSYFDTEYAIQNKMNDIQEKIGQDASN